ncbi:MAG: hypothetical protein QOF98_309, partial [Streptomyces sp.]|nr:hypothetical protein [Streptomyces sp.]
VIGDRKMDLAVRLEVAGLQFRVCADLDEALRAAPPGRIEAIANYSAFQDLRRRVGN